MNKKFRLKKGDNVVVISGESKGLRGRILEVDYRKESAIVEGVNMISKHSRPSAQDPKGGIIKKEAPIRICKLMYVGSGNTPTRIGRRVTDNGKIVRFSKKTGEEIK